jgi:DNA polymerase-3 subunit beta
MKFSVSSSELLKALNVAGGAIGTGSVVYILEDFLFDIKNGILTVTATNMEIAITTQVQVQSTENGTAAIPGRILMDTLKGLPPQPVTITLDEEKKLVELESSVGKYKMAFDKPEDFPKVPEADNDDKFSLPKSVLAHAISSSLFALSSDEMRIAMTGMYVQIDFDKVIFVATDAHKLVRNTYNGIGSNFSTSFILPKKALSLLKGVLSDNGEADISFNRNFAFFSWDNTKISCRLIEASYPDYNVVIPVHNPNKMTVSRDSLLSSLRRIIIFANKTTNQIVLSISDQSLTVSARDLDFSNEAIEQLNCSYEGDPISIGFNARFLIEMLSVMQDEEVVFEMSLPNKASLILPIQQNEKEDLLMLIMPVMIPGS